MYKTGYHAKYLAHQITLKESSYKQSAIKRTIYDASIQLNPHQVEAALFAIRAANDKGVILADEVGLGKTIEAGLVIAQSCSELKFKILIITPNALMKQWKAELQDKFALESEIIDSVSFKKLANKGMNPFDQEKILITSYGVAKNKADYIERTVLDLAILDEAHKLRTVKTMHKEIKRSLTGVKKILLTATPFQNYIEDIYNLCSFIDSEAFDNKMSFNYLFRNHALEMKDSIRQYIHRTLRKQVEDYVKYPNRLVRTYDFSLTNAEAKLYQLLSEYLHNENLYLFKNNRNQFIATTIRKQMASSTVALIGVLEKISNRLSKIYQEKRDTGFDLEEWADEFDQDVDEDEYVYDDSPIDDEASVILEEIEIINDLIQMALEIENDSRAFKLVEVLEQAFKGLETQKGANKKALIFTESVKTQNYLYHFLKKNGFDKIVRFSGQNNTDDCREIFEKWRKTHQFSESKSTAMREALVDEFRNRAEIMIATEAGSEGLNLQFCSTVINYDLPWNPQRIEQRIGRCHRYGQPVDVVVFNFTNQYNRVEQRLYELLSSKFNLFEDLLDSSDSILGLLDDGQGLEKKIAKIYQTCRTDEEIDRAFEELQYKSRNKINQKMKETKETLNAYFDEEISLRFKASEQELQRQLTILEEQFWELSKIQLQQKAYFQGMENEFKFILPQDLDVTPKGIYQLHTHFNMDDEEDVILYRTNSELGQYVIQTALEFNQNMDYIEFDLTNHPGNITSLNQYKGLKGYLSVVKIKTTGIVNQERLLVKAITEDYQVIPSPILTRLLNVNGSIQNHSFQNPFLECRLKEDLELSVKREVELINQENNEVYQLKKEQIIKDSKSQRQALKGVIEEYETLRDEIEYKLESIPDPDECDRLQEELDRLEDELDQLRQNQGVREKQVRERRTRKLNELKQQLKYETEEIFTIRFKIV